MAFSIVLGTTKDEEKKIGKTYTEGTTLTGTIRNDTPFSVQRPEVLVEANIFTLSGYNYAYISDFGRYYWIDDVQAYRTGLCILKLRVDVLKSFEDDIKNSYAVIKRSQTSENLEQADSMVPIKARKKNYRQQFPNGFDSESYILVVAGGDLNV